MSRYLVEGAELIDTTSNAMDRLLQYLDSNITILHDNLNEDNFNRVLLVIWEIMSQTLYELVNNNLQVFRHKIRARIVLFSKKASVFFFIKLSFL